MGTFEFNPSHHFVFPLLWVWVVERNGTDSDETGRVEICSNARRANMLAQGAA
jgi:hypothetical protein